LTLEHNVHNGAKAQALVDIKLLLETVTSDQTRVGEWVNVTGYITSIAMNGERHQVGIQALLLWSTGPLDLARYARSLDHAIAR
jgi:hypothetical protein